MRDGWHEPNRLARKSAGGRPMALRIGKFRLAADHHGRMMADPDRYRAALIAAPELLHIAVIVRARIWKETQQTRPFNPAALNRCVVGATVGLDSAAMARRYVVTHIIDMLTQGGQPAKIDIRALQHDFLNRRLRRRYIRRRNRRR
jgi:hypothetical protein